MSGLNSKFMQKNELLNLNAVQLIIKLFKKLLGEKDIFREKKGINLENHFELIICSQI